MRAYVDTSVLAAYYCPEPLSKMADRVLTALDRPVISLLSEVEFHSAVSRKQRCGELDSPSADKIRLTFRSHIADGYYTRADVIAAHYRKAREWIDHLETPLRTLDALHLAICDSQALRMLTADVVLKNACEELGIEVEHLVAE